MGCVGPMIEGSTMAMAMVVAAAVAVDTADEEAMVPAVVVDPVGDGEGVVWVVEAIEPATAIVTATAVLVAVVLMGMVWVDIMIWVTSGRLAVVRCLILMSPLNPYKQVRNFIMVGIPLSISPCDITNFPFRPHELLFSPLPHHSVLQNYDKSSHPYFICYPGYPCIFDVFP